MSHPTCTPVVCTVQVEHFGGRTSTHWVVVPRYPNESCLTVQQRAAAEYRRKHGLAARIVAFRLNCAD
jgi:hypothetical protein